MNWIEELRRLMGPEKVLVADSDRRVFEADAYLGAKALPQAVVLVNNAADVSTLARFCHEHKVPLVPRGAGTGLSGGATPHTEGVLVVFSRMRQVLALDTAARSAWVEPGHTNLALSALAPGLYYAPDPSSQMACSIGGNVAENAGGVHCLKYGLTVNNLHALEVVIPGGELLRLGGEGLDGPGLDLMALLTGSEGMLALTTAVGVRLLPTPQLAKVILAAFDSIEKGANAVAAVIAAGIIPAGLEMMDGATVRAVENYLHIGYPIEAEALLLLEADGTLEEVEDDIHAMTAVLQQQGAYRIEVSSNEQERQRFWLGRKKAFPVAGTLASDYIAMDGSVPRKNIAKLLALIAVMSEQYQLKCINVFHAGDGNLHPLILFNSATAGEAARADAFGMAILKACIDHGGTITGEHGVGVEKLQGMCQQFGAEELEVFAQLRQVFDPAGIMNPGKAIPTLNRCAEFGYQHVHAEAHPEPHPELPRF